MLKEIFSGNTDRKERVCLRVPVRFKAKVIVEGHPYKNVMVTDISTTGVCFTYFADSSSYIGGTDKLPQFFEIFFRLPDSDEDIKVFVEKKNEHIISGEVWIGCFFQEISDGDRKQIYKYIVGFLDCSRPWRIINVASFFLLIDAAVRIAGYLIDLYFRGTPFGRDVSLGEVSPLYGFVLFAYAGCCLISFIINDSINKKRFLVRVGCLTAAFIFIFIKFVKYLGMHIWQSPYASVISFFWAQFVLVVFTLLAIVTGISLARRINVISDSLKIHEEGISRRGA